MNTTAAAGIERDFFIVGVFLFENKATIMPIAPGKLRSVHIKYNDIKKPEKKNGEIPLFNTGRASYFSLSLAGSLVLVRSSAK